VCAAWPLAERIKIAMSKPKQPSDTSHQPGPKVVHRKRTRPQQQETPSVYQPNAAGIDIGAREIYVAVPVGRDEHPVRKCGTFTSDLHKMAEWLVNCGITTAAMESTGVYWIPVYDVLEQHGIQVCLVNPRNMKNVPGKRSDFHACQWIQHLHAMGLRHGRRGVRRASADAAPQ
jgi:Transposase